MSLNQIVDQNNNDLLDIYVNSITNANGDTLPSFSRNDGNYSVSAGSIDGTPRQYGATISGNKLELDGNLNIISASSGTTFNLTLDLPSYVPTTGSANIVSATLIGSNSLSFYILTSWIESMDIGARTVTFDIRRSDGQTLAADAFILNYNLVIDLDM